MRQSAKIYEQGHTYAAINLHGDAVDGGTVWQDLNETC